MCTLLHDLRSRDHTPLLAIFLMRKRLTKIVGLTEMVTVADSSLIARRGPSVQRFGPSRETDPLVGTRLAQRVALYARNTAVPRAAAYHSVPTRIAIVAAAATASE